MLFEEHVTYLSVLEDGKPVQKTAAELFDAKRFPRISIASFVASPDYLFRRLGAFTHLRMVLGEEENAQSFTALDSDGEIALIRSIPDEIIKERIVTQAWQFRAMPPKCHLHSKIYLLEGDDAAKVMIGSANLSRSAFESKQFEELLVFTDPQIVAYYKERFESIWQTGVEWLTPASIKRLKKVELHASEPHIESVEESTIVAQSVHVGQMEGGVVITPEFHAEVFQGKVELLRRSHEGLDEKTQELESSSARTLELQQQIKRQSELLNQITKKQKGQTVLKSPQEIGRIKEALLQTLSITNKKSEAFMELRPNLIWSRSVSDFYLQHGEQLQPYIDPPIHTEKLPEQLRRMERFIRSYSRFTNAKNRENEKKIFEAILITFASPLMWMLRAALSEERGREKLAEAPVILILGGHANSGKSRLLLTLSKLCGNPFDVLSYKNINTKGQRIIEDLMTSEILFPLFVDEIEKSFFESSGGQELIKHLTNRPPTPSPCLIGTTNTEFAPRAEVVRRISYLHFTDTFPLGDQQARKEADRYLKEEVGILDETVFKYLLHQMVLRIREGDPLMGEDDPLGIARQILKEAFSAHGIETDFISTNALGDFYTTGRVDWHAFYRTNRKLFEALRLEGENCLAVDLDRIYGGYGKKADHLKNRLPPDVVRSGGTPLVLRKESFFEFIGHKEGLWERLKGQS